jgi:hypothetical protein
MSNKIKNVICNIYLPYHSCSVKNIERLGMAHMNKIKKNCENGHTTKSNLHVQHNPY